MAYNVAEVYKSALEAKGVSFSVAGEEGNVILTGFKLNNTRVRVVVAFDDEKTVQIKGLSFVNVPKGKMEVLYKLVNECNSHFRWVKFYINDDQDDIIAMADAVIDLETCVEEIEGLIMRMGAIVDQAYEIIMKGIWA